MKILHLLSQYPDSTGSGIYLQAILKEAHKHGHSSSLVAAANTDRTPQLSAVLDHFSLVEFGESPLDFRLPGMSDVMPYPSTRFIELDEDQLKNYKSSFLQQIDILIEKISPDVIHSHHLWLLSSYVKKNYPHIPLLTNCHGSDLRQFRLCSHLRDRVLEGCREIDIILALTEAQKNEIIGLHNIPEKNIEIVGAGFDDKLFSWSPKPDIPPVIITYCGKLSRAKGVPWLLKALSISRMNDYELHLIGEGSGEDKLECIELAAKIGSRVKFHGNLNQNDLAAHLRKSHIFVLPSMFEGLPLTVLEALACGCRIITTKLPGCIEIANLVGSELVHLIDLPRLLNTDIPHREDEAEFVSNLCNGLKEVYDFCKLHPPLNKDFIEKRIQPYTWQMVFSRIEKCYFKLHTQGP